MAAVFGVIAFAVAYYVQARFNSGVGWNTYDTPPAWFVAFVVACIAAALVRISWPLFLVFWKLPKTVRASLEEASISSKSKLAVAVTVCLLFVGTGGLLWSFAFYQIGFYPPPGSPLWEQLEAQYLKVGARLVAIGIVLLVITFAYFLFGYGRTERKP